MDRWGPNHITKEDQRRHISATFYTAFFKEKTRALEIEQHARALNKDADSPEKSSSSSCVRPTRGSGRAAAGCIGNSLSPVDRSRMMRKKAKVVFTLWIYVYLAPGNAARIPKYVHYHVYYTNYRSICTTPPLPTASSLALHGSCRLHAYYKMHFFFF